MKYLVPDILDAAHSELYIIAYHVCLFSFIVYLLCLSVLVPVCLSEKLWARHCRVELVENDGVIRRDISHI